MLARGVVPSLGVSRRGLAALEAAARVARADTAAVPLVPGPEPVAPRLLDRSRGQGAARRIMACPCREGRRPQAPAEAAARVGGDRISGGSSRRWASPTRPRRARWRLNLADAGAVEGGGGGGEWAARRYLVARSMVTDGVAEIIVGILRDPAHGFVLTLGAGGVLAEDAGRHRVPASARDGGRDRRRARPACAWRRFWAAIGGGPPRTERRWSAAVLAVQDCATAHADTLTELEVNPLIDHARTAPSRSIAPDQTLERSHDRHPHPDHTPRRGAGGQRWTAPRPMPSTRPPAASWARSSWRFATIPDLRVAILTGAARSSSAPVGT